MALPSSLRLLLLGPLLLAPKPSAPKVAAAPPAPLRWTDETPDAMIADAVARATVPGAPDADVLAAAFVIHALDARAENGRAEQALRDIAAKAAPAVSGDVLL